MAIGDIISLATRGAFKIPTGAIDADYPAVSTVLLGIAFDGGNFSGTYVPTDASDVRYGVVFGAAGVLTGELPYAAPVQGTARTLSPRLLNRIASRITAAGEELQIFESFVLVEKDIQGVITDSNYNPFTGEDSPGSEDLSGDQYAVKETTFSAELDIITLEDMQRTAAGDIHIGDMFLTVNSNEMVLRGFNLTRLRNALYIKISINIDINKYGAPVTVNQGKYQIFQVIPDMIRNRMMEVELRLRPFATERDAN